MTTAEIIAEMARLSKILLDRCAEVDDQGYEDLLEIEERVDMTIIRSRSIQFLAVSKTRPIPGRNA